MIRGVRGATTVKKNRAEEIVTNTHVLLEEMIVENKIDPDQVASIQISTTEDLNATFPAKAVRKIEGWTFVPVMCMREIPVPQSLERCIRVMMHVNTEVSQRDIRHIYQFEAKQLRPDLIQEEGKGLS
ncbi:chorismate mutase [Pontibacillus chungwhensis BH030062]|uniref:chorismate mutase n=1 Tax=Pontibacillus chungwhensis BH030062 TaxID=1385513 RepID=A0A0A2V243_9BACI|nr:chorismate mutase [Pontibacillus chungwhensis]KGP93128.1 chorismate mutase [Pontibacillus chungwhensis BH030062]